MRGVLGLPNWKTRPLTCYYSSCGAAPQLGLLPALIPGSGLAGALGLVLSGFAQHVPLVRVDQDR